MSAVAHVRVDGSALAGQNFGIDPDATAKRFAGLLREAVARSMPGVEFRVSFGSGASMRVEHDDEARAEELARELELLAYGVRKAADYLVFS